MKKTNPHWNTITHENSSVRLFEFLVLVANLTDGQTVTWLKKQPVSIVLGISLQNVFNCCDYFRMPCV